MKHPAEFFMKSLIIREPAITDAQVLQAIDRLGFLAPEATYLGFLRMEIPAPPEPFNPGDRFHRESMRYLRDAQVYELFHQTPAMAEAWAYLADPNKRMVVEEVLLARLDLKSTASRLNKKHNWHLSEEGLELYRHYFWNVNLLTFDQWGRYLYERSSLYDRYMSLLQADKTLAYFLLRLDQVLDSKKMIQRAQEIAYFTLEEVNNVPGVRNDKIKAIGILTKSINDCHASLSTSDMALSGVLKEFEKFRMEHRELPATDIKNLAPVGNFTGSGSEPKKEEVN